MFGPRLMFAEFVFMGGSGPAIASRHAKMFWLDRHFAMDYFVHQTESLVFTAPLQCWPVQLAGELRDADLLIRPDAAN